MTTYTYTGAVQTHNVDPDATLVEIQCWGAEGGDATAGSVGGLGGYVRYTIPVSGGEVLDVYVGGEGGLYTAAGWPDGGNGGQAAGAGGGSSSVRPTGVTQPIAMAGGGGGAGAAASGSNGGAAGAWPTSAPGSGTNAGGGGNWNSAGGAKGSGAGTHTAGAAYQGGAGQDSPTGGGGGGGGVGGGGGGGNATVSSGGGAGASYMNPATVIADRKEIEVAAGVRSGDGLVIITDYIPDANDVPDATGGNSIVEPGDGYRYHIFTSSGTLSPTVTGRAEVLIVGGGGGSPSVSSTRRAGGGGGGRAFLRDVNIVDGVDVTVTVGAGGTSGGTNGAESRFGPDIVAGGGSGSNAGSNGITSAGSGGGKTGVGSGSQPAIPSFHMTGFGGGAGRGSVPSTGGGGGGGGQTGIGGDALTAGSYGTAGPGFTAPAWAAALSLGNPFGTYGRGGGTGGSNAANSGNGGTGVQAGGTGLVVVRYRLPYTAFSVDLDSSPEMDTTVVIVEPKTLVTADLSSAPTMSVSMRSRFRRRNPPRREWLWIEGLDGEQKGVIR